MYCGCCACTQIYFLNHVCVSVHTHPYMYAYLHCENKTMNQVSGIADVCGIIGTTNPIMQTQFM